jgi:DNA-binding CsgD family transcriptional regulator
MRSLEALIRELGVPLADAQERNQGAAFLRVAREAYPLSSVVYLALNIPIAREKTERFIHCMYADAWARHATSRERVHVERLGLSALFETRDEGQSSDLSELSADWSQAGACDLAIALTGYHGESAALLITADKTMEDWSARKATIAREFGALGQYFHQHMLRIFGRGNERAFIVSAREIDCLKWMAAGKTAWEVSTILGISERTVRFHLNAAREKLQCTTTTQAVAKAVSQQLFVP